MCEPFSAGAIFASVGSAFKFADLAVRIAEVGSENEVFVRTIHVVRDDLQEVERLLMVDSVLTKLTSTPGKLPWVKSAINNTKSALNEIGKWVERARAEQQSTGSIQFNTRVKWVFNDHEKLLNRKTELTTCHQQLSNVLGYLIRLEDISTAPEPPTYQDTTYFDDIISRHKRKSVWKAPDDIQAHTGAINVNDRLPIVLNNSSTQTQLKARKPVALDAYESIQTNRTMPHYGLSTLEPPQSPLSEPPTPSSPPPTYASAVQFRTQPQHTGLDDKRDLKEEYPFQKSDQVSMNKANLINPSPQKCEAKDTWAYRATPTPTNVTISELAGDTVGLSGTNAFGPVNPFDYFPEAVPQTLVSSHKNHGSKDVVEMLGDVSFAVELPTNDPGPPPGYPSRKAKSTSYNLECGILASQTRSYKKSVSLSELPAIPSRRPVPSHMSSEPIVSTYSGQTRSFARHSIATFPVNSAVESPRNQNSTEFGLSQKLSELSTGLDPPTRSDSYSTRSKSSILPLEELPESVSSGSTSGGLTNGRRGNNYQGGGTLCNVDENPLPSNSRKPAESSTATRMRRQRHMMDLLGSVGS